MSPYSRDFVDIGTLQRCTRENWDKQILTMDSQTPQILPSMFRHRRGENTALHESLGMTVQNAALSLDQAFPSTVVERPVSAEDSFARRPVSVQSLLVGHLALQPSPNSLRISPHTSHSAGSWVFAHRI